MPLNWKKWGLSFWSSLGRHVGTAGLAALSISYREGKLDWRNLGIAVVAGGIIPAVFTFLQSTPTPDEEDPNK